MIEYESQARATREKTARLKELRLAKEAETRSIILLCTSLAPEHGVISSSATHTKLDSFSAALRLAMCERLP
jgi:hypothetical protein